jgi:hypothetical protein
LISAFISLAEKTAMESKILKLEEQLVASILSSDVEVLDDLLHDQLVFVNHQGITLSKKEDLAPHISQDLKITSLAISDQQLQLFGDTAVVVVTKEIEGSYLKQPFESKLKFTRIWKLYEQDWKVIAVTSVPLHVG